MESTMELNKVKFKSLILDQYKSRFITSDYCKLKTIYQPKLAPIQEEQEANYSPSIVVNYK